MIQLRIPLVHENHSVVNNACYELLPTDHEVMQRRIQNNSIIYNSKKDQAKLHTDTRLKLKKETQSRSAPPSITAKTDKLPSVYTPVDVLQHHNNLVGDGSCYYIYSSSQSRNKHINLFTYLRRGPYTSSQFPVTKMSK